MADTFTSLLRLVLQETGGNQNIWGDINNASVVQLLETAIAGRVAVDVTAADVVLTTVNGATDQARNAMLAVIGNPGVARDITVPSTSKIYMVSNETSPAFAVTIKTAAGIGVVVAGGEMVFVYVDSSADETFFIASTVPATETQLGVAELATQAEVDAGSDDTRIVTAFKLENTTSVLQANDVRRFGAVRDEVTDDAAAFQAAFNAAANGSRLVYAPGGSLGYLIKAELDRKGCSIVGDGAGHVPGPHTKIITDINVANKALFSDSTAPIGTLISDMWIDMTGETLLVDAIDYKKGSNQVRHVRLRIEGPTGTGAAGIHIRGEDPDNLGTGLNKQFNSYTEECRINGFDYGYWLQGALPAISNSSANGHVMIGGGISGSGISAIRVRGQGNTWIGVTVNPSLTDTKRTHFEDSSGGAFHNAFNNCYFDAASGKIHFFDTLVGNTDPAALFFGGLNVGLNRIDDINSANRPVLITGSSQQFFGTTRINKLNQRDRILVGTTSISLAESKDAHMFEGENDPSPGRWVSWRTGGSGEPHAQFRNNGANVGGITSNSTTTSFVTSSDYRLKKKIAAIVGPIKKLMSLRPINFSFKKTPDVTVQGFLAHEVAKICPQAVVGEKDAMVEVGNLLDASGEIVHSNVEKPDKLGSGMKWENTGTEPAYQQMDVSKLVPLLTAAIQQQQTELEDALNRIETLESDGKL